METTQEMLNTLQAVAQQEIANQGVFARPRPASDFDGFDYDAMCDCQEAGLIDLTAGKLTPEGRALIS
jgi:hypothetical protein